MRKLLSDLSSFADAKINVASLDANTYISTENMLPNKQGITRSAGLPTASQTQAYKSNDILVSNIRPYFKKIWFADRNGGCSNDVLVFRAKNNCYPRFLYYLLADDNFFDYSTSTSKGTKMPRGDKYAIMRYSVSYLPSLPEQRAIAATLSCLDDKIALNNAVNHHLEQVAQAIFKSWFVDFEPWGGVMPEDWRYEKLDNICQSVSKTHSFDKNNLLFFNTSDIKQRQIISHEPTRTRFLLRKITKNSNLNYILSMFILYPNECNTLVNVLKFILSAFLLRIFCIIVGDTPALCANALTEICSDSIFSNTNSDKRNSVYSLSNFAFLLGSLLIIWSNVVFIIFFLRFSFPNNLVYIS